MTTLASVPHAMAAARLDSALEELCAEHLAEDPDGGGYSSALRDNRKKRLKSLVEAVAVSEVGVPNRQI